MIKNKVNFIRKYDEENPGSGEILKNFFDELKGELLRGRVIAIPCFGIFEVYERPTRTGRDIVSGKIKTFPSKKRMRFRPSVTIKKKINDKAASEGLAK